MTARTQDIVVGTILLVLAVAWCAIVLQTIPAGQGGGDIGPRAFPLWLGVFLAVMAGLLLLRSLMSRGGTSRAPNAPDLPETAPADRREELWLVGLTFGLLLLYGLILPVIGFNLATALVVALTLWLCVRVRSWAVLTGMTIGIPAATWLVFGKILHIPLATGSWINLG